MADCNSDYSYFLDFMFVLETPGIIMSPLTVILRISGSLSAALMGHGPYTAVALFSSEDSWFDVLTDIVHLQILT